MNIMNIVHVNSFWARCSVILDSRHDDTDDSILRDSINVMTDWDV